MPAWWTDNSSAKQFFFKKYGKHVAHPDKEIQEGPEWPAGTPDFLNSETLVFLTKLL